MPDPSPSFSLCQEGQAFLQLYADGRRIGKALLNRSSIDDAVPSEKSVQ